jgi:hypothetical protein
VLVVVEEEAVLVLLPQFGFLQLRSTAQTAFIGNFMFRSGFLINAQLMSMPLT